MHGLLMKHVTHPALGGVLDGGRALPRVGATAR